MNLVGSGTRARLGPKGLLSNGNDPPRPCNKRVTNCPFKGSKSRQKALEMTISTSKIEKALKKSVLFMLAPQPGLEPGTYGLTENLAAEKTL